MSFWNSDRLRRELGRVIHLEDGKPPDPGAISEAAYEMSLGPEAYISGSAQKIELGESGMVVIAPGEIGVLITEEIVEIPRDVLGFISLKSSVKIPGLINVSGFHVDPGFKGRLVFTVYNAGTQPCAFTRRQKMFLIWFAKLEAAEKKDHAGVRQDKRSILGNDITRLTGELASPAKLNKRIERLEIMGKVYGALLLAFVIAVATLFIRGGLTEEVDQPRPAVIDQPAGEPSNALPNDSRQIEPGPERANGTDEVTPSTEVEE